MAREETPQRKVSVEMVCRECKTIKTSDIWIYIDMKPPEKTEYTCATCNDAKVGRVFMERFKNHEECENFFGWAMTLARWKYENSKEWQGYLETRLSKSRAAGNRAYYKRKIRKANAPGNYTYELWMQKVEYWDWKCAYCGKQLDKDTLNMDHRIALARPNTSNFISNLVPSCQTCNSRKYLYKWPLKIRVDDTRYH